MISVNFLDPIQGIARDRKWMTSVFILTLIYALGISAVLRANFYYIDDMGRALWGSKEWYYFSMYIPQYFSTILHADSHLTDVSPLPQLLAVVIVAISAAIVLRVVTERNHFTFIEYVSMVPLGLSPYFLECLSYKYDSPYMALSILASVVPVLFYRSNAWTYLISIVLGMIVVCLSYQAASGIFPMLVVLLVLKMWNQKAEMKEMIRFILISAGGYLAGMLIFVLFLMRPTDVYVSNTVPSVMEMIPLAGYHLKKYYYYVITDFKKEWLVMIALLCVGFLYVTVRNSKQKWIHALLMGFVVLGMFLVMAFGLYPVLKQPGFEPRAMYGFGACLCFIALYTVSQNHSRLAKLVCLALCWCFFVFGFTYGNALYAQKTYTDYRISAVIDDLDELDVLDTDYDKIYQINGSIGRAPEIEGMPQDYQMLNRLVPITFGDSSWEWARFGFTKYYRLKNVEWDTSIDLRDYNLPLLEESVYHTIWGDSQYILIELKW